MSEARELDHEEPDEQHSKSRSADLLGRRDSACRKALDKVWDRVRRAFEDQYERADLQNDCWEAYNCHLNDMQIYESRSQIAVPIIYDAVNAIVTRVSNQLFPEGGHYVDAVTDESTRPGAIVALLDKYLGDAQAKTAICKPLLRHGYLEGQFNLYCDWREIDREIVSRETHGVYAPMGGTEELEAPDEIDDVGWERIREARPGVEVLHDSDVAIDPPSADGVEEALAAGGFVAIVRRWSQAKVEALYDSGIIVDPAASQLIEQMEAQYSSRRGAPRDLENALAEMAGIRHKGRLATVWEVWKMLPLTPGGAYAKGGVRRICQSFLGPDRMILGCRRNPHWNDRVPLISEPTEKVAGVAKGMIPVERVLSLQYEANDAANEGADMSHMSACGLVLRDPTTAGKQPLLMNVGAVWDVPPDAVRFAEFPDLTPRAISRIQYCIAQTFQTLGVNPSMLPQQTSQSRRNQAQVAQEQQVDLLTTTEAASVLVEGVFTPMLAWFVDLDYQYRDRDASAMVYGMLGVEATMQAVPPQLNRSAWKFKWVGVERARNAMVFQQKVGFLNVARGVEPILAKNGYRLNLAMAIEQAAIDLWGPHDGPKIIEDIRHQLSVDPDLENRLMSDGHYIPVHTLDDDQKHLAAHQAAAQRQGSPDNFKIHIQSHIIARNQKQQAAAAQAAQQQMQQLQQGGRPGGQPGAPPSRGGAMPRIGAMPQGPRAAISPPGAVHPDQLPRAGAVPFPRRF